MGARRPLALTSTRNITMQEAIELREVAVQVTLLARVEAQVLVREDDSVHDDQSD